MCNNDFYVESLMAMYGIVLRLVHSRKEAHRHAYIRNRNLPFSERFLYVERC